MSKKKPLSYDESCEDLAREFLTAVDTLSYEDIQKHAPPLAQVIQDAIEAFLNDLEAARSKGAPR